MTFLFVHVVFMSLIMKHAHIHYKVRIGKGKTMALIVYYEKHTLISNIIKTTDRQSE